MTEQAEAELWDLGAQLGTWVGRSFLIRGGVCAGVWPRSTTATSEPSSRQPAGPCQHPDCTLGCESAPYGCLAPHTTHEGSAWGDGFSEKDGGCPACRDLEDSTGM